MGEFTDSDSAERLAFEAPDEYLRRRDFLGRVAMLAGMSAGMGLLLDPETLIVNISHAPTAEEVESELAEAEAEAGIEHEAPAAEAEAEAPAEEPAAEESGDSE